MIPQNIQTNLNNKYNLSANYKKGNFFKQKNQLTALSFQRMPDPGPETDLTKSTINAAYAELGKKTRALMTPVFSFPQIKSEDTGSGSLVSKGTENLLETASLLGFNAIQILPEGKTYHAPYNSTVFSTNPNFITLKELTEEKWGFLLSDKKCNEVIKADKGKEIVEIPGGDRPIPVDFDYNKYRINYDFLADKKMKAIYDASYNFDAALRRVSGEELNPEEKKRADTLEQRFKEKNPNIDFNEKINSLNKEFNEFKAKNKDWLHKDALYETLVYAHKNDKNIVEIDINNLKEDETGKTINGINLNKVDANLCTYLNMNENSNERKAAEKRKAFLEHRIKSPAYTEYIDDLVSQGENENKLHEESKKLVKELRVYKFSQFVVNSQKKEFIDLAKSKNVDVIFGDALIGFSARDYWANKEAFSKDY